MTDEPTREDEVEFLATLYSDPIGPSAAKAGRNLVVGALLLLAVAKFGATVQATTLFPISFTQPKVLPTVLSVLVGILGLNFISRVIPDLLRFREVDVRIIRFINAQKVANASAAARAVDAEIYRDPEEEGAPEPEDWWEDYVKIRDEANSSTEAAEKRLGDRKLPRWMRLIRTLGEVSVPLGLAALALWTARTVFHWQ